MRITNLRRAVLGDRTRVSADVSWEDCAETGREVFLETLTPYGIDLFPNPDAFLIGCLLPAMHRGEHRIAIEGEVCPQLLEGLNTAMALLQSWYGPRYQPIPIETHGLRSPLDRRDASRSGVFLSGGIDSFTVLRNNHLHFPPGHPARVRDGFVLHGFDIGGVLERGLKYHVFDRALKAIAPVAEAAELKMIPVYTNFRHLCDEGTLWLEKFFGSVLAAVAHGFSSRIHRVEIASSCHLPYLVPNASHPMLDPLYSSYDLLIRHRDVEISRFEKLRIVSEWDVAVQNLRVCLQNVPDRLNCGWCEKCVRTMTGLVALGKLGQTRAFVEDDVSAELLSRAEMTIKNREPFYLEMVKPLRLQGRDDLAEVILNKVAAKGKI